MGEVIVVFPVLDEKEVFMLKAEWNGYLAILTTPNLQGTPNQMTTKKSSDNTGGSCRNLCWNESAGVEPG